MLKLKNINKDYKMPTYKVEALKNANLSFRKNEFVSILGPSGSGKTTLLNIIGGLDKYTSGDLIINGVSTKDFKDKDWDVYRNHRVGFIFQSYNLIPHQTVLKNVELALTIAGFSKEERIQKAKDALDSVGLSDQYYKKPNQLSGGQSQRVAIARAIINDPDILLADEPTGAIDSETSKQILDLIKEISKDKLVIMVTHNAELASEYSTRIINLLDGEIVGDSNPLIEEDKPTIKETRRVSKDETAKMGLITTFLLSLNNLISKKSRTILTVVASSIGIIGIALVLSLSYGLTLYTDKLQDDMLSGNPVVIAKSAFDINAAISQMGPPKSLNYDKEKDVVLVNKMIEEVKERFQAMDGLFIENFITEDYIKYVEQLPEEDVAALFFDYKLDVTNNIYFEFQENADSETEIISMAVLKAIAIDILKQNKDTKPFANLASDFIAGVKQAPDNKEYIMSQYDILEGEVATGVDEVMLVLNKDGMIADFLLAQLGYYRLDEFVNEILRINGDPNYDESISFKSKFEYHELIDKKFTWYPNDVVFNSQIHNPMQPFTYNAYKSEFIKDDTRGLDLKIVGILQPKEDIQYGTLSSGFYYTEALANHIMAENKDSLIVQNLKNNHESENDMIYTGTTLGGMESGITFQYTYTYNNKEISKTGFVGKQNSLLGMLGMFGGGGGGSEYDDLEIYTLTLRDLGGSELVGSISIYPTNLNHKKNILDYLDLWNSDEDIIVGEVTLTKDDRESITYTDQLGVIFKMINDAINLTTIALVVFTSLALVVSSVMIAIITYVSVVERTNEIGVIRSLGGRKRDVSNLFIAETFMIGLTAGVFAVLVTYGASAIINLIVYKRIGGNIAHFPWHYALIMITVSTGLSLISGLVPARSAAKKDPVDALRVE